MLANINPASPPPVASGKQLGSVDNRAPREPQVNVFYRTVICLTIEVEGQTVRLTGSAEQQYAKWRSMLKQIYAQETGLIGEFETLPEMDQSSPQELNEQQ